MQKETKSVTATKPQPSQTVKRLEVPGLSLVDQVTMTDSGPALLQVPTASATRPNDPTGLYLATQGGLVLRLDLERRKLDPDPIWDFSPQVNAMRAAAERYPKRRFSHLRYPQDFVTDMGLSDERGLLGLVWHPNDPDLVFVQLSQATDRAAYDHYSTVLRVNLRTREQEELLRVPQRQFNHNGGDLAFGPLDGALYLGFGDEGGFNDEHGSRLLQDQAGETGGYFGNAQDPTVPYGKILRINVFVDRQGRAEGKRYGIPSDNPYRDAKVSQWPEPVRRHFSGPRVWPEIWAMGLRNPWKFSFSHRPGDGDQRRCWSLFVADVGQFEREEVNAVRLDRAQHGLNYGWRAMEGDRVFDRDLLKLLQDHGSVGFQEPILAYPRQDGVAVIGGYTLQRESEEYLAVAAELLRRFGQVVDDLYLFGDYQGRVFVGWNQFGQPKRAWQMRELFRLSGREIHSFGRDQAGRLYLLWTQSFQQWDPKGTKLSGVSLLEWSVPTVSAASITPSFGKAWMSDLGYTAQQITGAGLSQNGHFLSVAGYLGQRDRHAIGSRALMAASRMEDPLRRDPESGEPMPPKMHVVVLSRPVDPEAPAARWPRHHMRTGAGMGESQDDAWFGSADIALAKAYSAMAFSSDQNAMTTRSLGELSQPGMPLYGLGKTNLGTQGPPGSGVKREGLGVVTFPGGIPLYDRGGKRLVGGIGVSGSTPEVDEAVAMAGARGWEPVPAIRIDVVTGSNPDVPTIRYTKRSDDAKASSAAKKNE